MFSLKSHAILVISKIVHRHRGVAQAASFLYAEVRRSTDLVVVVTA